MAKDGLEPPKCWDCGYLPQQAPYSALSGSSSYLDQEVLLGVMMQWGDGSLGTKPGIDSDLFLFPVTQATVIRNADVLLQLWDLRVVAESRSQS